MKRYNLYSNNFYKERITNNEFHKASQKALANIILNTF